MLVANIYTGGMQVTTPWRTRCNTCKVCKLSLTRDGKTNGELGSLQF